MRALNSKAISIAIGMLGNLYKPVNHKKDVYNRVPKSKCLATARLLRPPSERRYCHWAIARKRSRASVGRALKFLRLHRTGTPKEARA